MPKNVNDYNFHVASNQLLQKAIQLHYDRYVEVGFFQKGESDPYQDVSTYFAAVYTEDESVVGVSRLIFKPMDELPAMKEFEIYDIDRARLKQWDRDRVRYAEMSALTKLPGHECTLGVLRTALQYSLERGTYQWFCSLDERVHNYMKRMFGFPFRIIGEPRVYLGSKTIPCTLDLLETREVLKEKRYKLFDYLYTSTPMEVTK